MNRRFFIVGAAAGALTLRAAILPAFAQETGTPLATPPAPDACIYPAELLGQTQNLIDALRERLAAHNLLNIPADIAEFYHGMVVHYESAFARQEDRLSEVDEAGVILDDPACYVAAPPEEGCVYYEAWKYFYHREALSLYPADGSVAFAALSNADQLRVAEGTVAYAGMLQNIFGSLMAHYGIETDLSVLTSHLYLQSENMGTLLTAAGQCPPQEVPPTNTPIIRAPVPRGPTIMVAQI